MNKILRECYQELYKKAKPSADFDKLIETKEAKKPQWFMRYYLPDDKQEEIIRAICAKHSLSKRETQVFVNSVLLGCAPNGCERTWKEARLTKLKSEEDHHPTGQGAE